MPLIKGKSKKAFEKNIETEMHAGKPQEQALAIAYKMKRKKMAMGGDAKHQSEAHEEDMVHMPENEAPPADYTKSMGRKERAMMAAGGFIGSHQPEGKGHTIHIHVNPQAQYNPTETPGPAANGAATSEDARGLNQHGEDETGPMGAYAEGGMAHQSDAHEMDMVGRIMKKRQECYSEGGKVANADSGESTDDPDTFAKADPNEFDDLAMRDDLESEYTGANSGDEDGSKLNQEDDFVGRVMKKRAKR